MINRRKFIKGAMAASALMGSRLSSVRAEGKPNILFILADDLGYGDLSSFGRPDYKTPNLDRLAQNGVRFTSAYSASPVCTPTRCAFITGRYPCRTLVGLEEPLSWKKVIGDRVGLPAEHPTIASLLKNNGYETALVGKWHLGYLPKYGPIQSGFNEFFGIMSGGVDYFTHKDALGDPDLYEDKVPAERIGYMTDLLTERAIKFISRRRSSPFYLSLHYTAPHWPWEGPGDESVSKRLRDFVASGSLKVYGAMMKSLDDGIGRVIESLRINRIEKKTLVIFTSDNGGERFSYNWPFSGQKFDLREGGIRVPAIVYCPGTVPSGRVTEQVAITMDWTATILAAAKTPADPDYPLDGDDLFPVIKGIRSPYERTIYWRTKRQDAVRKGNWKYLKEGNSEFLFDLSVDQREQAESKEENPEVFQQIRAAFNAWDSQMLPRPEPKNSKNP